MARKQIVTDENIRQAVLDLVCEGILPVTAQVRQRLLDTLGHAGATDRIARITTELVSSLGQTMRAPLSNPNIPAELLDRTGDLVAQLYALALAKADEALVGVRASIEAEKQKAVSAAEDRARDLEHRHAVLSGQLKQAKDRIKDLQGSEAKLVARNENLKAELQVAQAQLDNATKRINELEEALKSAAATPGLDMDELVARVTQAVKGKKS